MYYNKSIYICLIFQIPAWIKAELQNTEDHDNGNDAELDDTSDHSDEEIPEKSPVQESSMSSIQINKDLGHGQSLAY